MKHIRENSLCVVHIRWAQQVRLSHRPLAALVCQDSLGPGIGGQVVLGFLINTLLSQSKPYSGYSAPESN